MAYQYDELGNIIGEYESEEERRLREAINQPVKQTTTYNPDGTSEVTIKGTPEALSAANPNTPTITGPVSPDETYRRMLQVESGNRNFTPSGQPVTSPKGAMFASQVMPATAANPGYGIRPAASQTPEEYNRVGQEYYQAMLKQFGGDQQKAAAAYNAGPGRVQQNMAQNQGQMNVGQLPKETQGYLQKIGQAVGNMIPSAQAGTLPVNPAAMQPAPQAQPQPQVQPAIQAQPQAQQSQYSLAGMPQLGLRAPQATTPPATTDSSMYIQQYVDMQDDPRKLIQYGFSESTPEPLRNRAKSRAAELIQQQQGEAEAKQRMSTMNETELAKALREKTSGGSYLKAMLFNTLGMTNSAMAEKAKLGIGKEQTVMLSDGTPAIIKIADNGTPISGYNATTGAKLSANDLVAAQAGATRKLNIVGGTFINDTTGEVGRVITDEKTGQSYIQTDTGRKPMTGFRPQASTGSLSDQRTRTIQDINLKLQGKGIEEQMRILSDYNKQLAGAGFPIVQPSEVGINVPQISGQAPARAPAPAQMPAQAPAQMPAGPVSPAAVAAPATQPRPTIAELGARKDIVTDAAKQVAASADTQNMLGSINKVTGLLDSGEHNIGSALSGFAGRGPVAQAIGSQFETTDAKNTKTIMDTVQKLAADGLKSLGSNPSTVDLEFWTRFKPDASSDPQFVKEWIESRSADLKRRLGYATSQVGAGGGAGTAPPAETQLSPQERARQELARRKKKD